MMYEWAAIKGIPHKCNAKKTAGRLRKQLEVKFKFSRNNLNLDRKNLDKKLDRNSAPNLNEERKTKKRKLLPKSTIPVERSAALLRSLSLYKHQ